MTGIRRIRDLDSEAEQAVELWDRMCRETPDGGPLSRVGRANLKRMLAMLAWHRESFCLVAVEANEPAERIVGFVVGRLESGDGLLPGAAGELTEWYVPPERADADELRRRLLEAAIAELRAGGAGWVVRAELDKDDRAERAFLEGLGFEADMVTLSLYDDTDRSGCSEPAP